MYDTLPDEGHEAITDLCEHIDTIFLIHLSAGFHDFGDVAIAKLLDDVVVFAAFHDVDELDDVGVMHGLHDFYLLEEGAF